MALYDILAESEKMRQMREGRETMICPICRGTMRWNNERFACPVCGFDDTPKPKTNADFLRSMSDEEFATAICKHDGCPFREAEDDECLKHHYDCKACWLDWLKQEVEEGE